MVPSHITAKSDSFIYYLSIEDIIFKEHNKAQAVLHS